MNFLFNLILSATSIAVVLWVSKRNVVLAGFIGAFPLGTLITLALGKFGGMEDGALIALAKSIFVAIPASLMFFIPFLLAQRLRLSFWQCYGSGFAMLAVGFVAHRFVSSLVLK